MIRCSIAEAIVQATAESRFGFSHDHSMLAEMTVSNYAVNNISLPEGIIRQLETSPAERERIIKSADQEMLRYLLLGINCDKDWDNLPLFVRTFLLERCYGKPCRASAAQLDWIRSKFCQQGSLTVEEVVARSNLGGILTLLAASFAESIEADCTHLNPLEAPDSSYEKYIDTTLLSIKNDPDRRLIDVIKGPIMQFFNGVRVSIKFVVISIVADPEFQRELDYLVFEKPWLIRSFATCTLNAVWLFCKTLQRIVLPFFLVSSGIRPKSSALLSIDYSSTSANVSQSFITT